MAYTSLTLMNGQFIVFDGPDGSGTTRQCELFVENLRKSKKNVLLTAEPTESSIGQEIREMLLRDTMPSPDAIQLLFCADRANHVSTVLAPALKKGQIVVSDRYSLSTIVYGEAQGVDKEWLESINAKFPRPDLTFITLPPFDVCMERLQRRKTRDQFEMENFQRRVYENYKSIEDPSVIFIDTSGNKQKNAEFVWQKYLEHFDEISQESKVKVG
jgi:dTMP kinase